MSNDDQVEDMMAERKINHVKFRTGSEKSLPR